MTPYLWLSMAMSGASIGIAVLAVLRMRHIDRMHEQLWECIRLLEDGE